MATDLHKELAIRGLSWLNSKISGKGKRWATEFCITNGYVADSCCFALQQGRFLVRMFNKPEAWPHSLLYIFEAKVSKTDFNKTFKNPNSNRLRLIGNIHYIVTPRDLVTVNDIPLGWGWLIKSGNGLREIMRPHYNEISEDFRNKVAYNMLWDAYNYRSAIEDWELRRNELFDQSQ